MLMVSRGCGNASRERAQQRRKLIAFVRYLERLQEGGREPGPASTVISWEGSSVFQGIDEEHAAIPGIELPRRGA